VNDSSGVERRSIKPAQAPAAGSVVQCNLLQVVVAPARAAVACCICYQQHIFSSVLRVRSLATYLAGSQYITWLSWSEVFTASPDNSRPSDSHKANNSTYKKNKRIHSDFPLFILRNGERQRGVEHGVHHVHKGHVGNDGAKQIRRRFTTAPISNPPADPPSIATLAASPKLAAVKCSTQATKSVKVFRLVSIFPRRATARQVAAAAHVRIGHHHAAIQQAQPVRAESSGSE